MAKIKLMPNKGSIEESKNIKVVLEELDSYHGCNVFLENKTNNNEININNNDDNFIVIDKDTIEFEIDLNISDDFKGTFISLFAIIKYNDDIKNILITSFFIDEGESEFYGNIFLDSTFLSFSDIGHIEITSKPLSKFIFSIKNKNISIFTKEDGTGSFHIKISDIIDEDVFGIERYPIYFYDSEDNYTKKKFTGIYINIIPENIKTFSYHDPRCDPDSEHYIANWRDYEIPDYCHDLPPHGCQSDEDCPSGYICINGECVRVDAPPPSNIDIERQCLENVDYSYTNMCRLNSTSFTMLGNGVVFGAFSSIQRIGVNVNDEKYNVSGYGYDFFRTSIVNNIIFSEDISICPNLSDELDTHIDHGHVHIDHGHVHNDSMIDYNLRIYISENAYCVLKNTNLEEEEIRSILMYKYPTYISFKVLSVEYDEYSGDYIAVLENSNSNFIFYDYIFCVPAIFYDMSEDRKNNTSMVNQNQNPNYILDNEENYIRIVNVDVSSNPYHMLCEDEDITDT